MTQTAPDQTAPDRKFVPSQHPQYLQIQRLINEALQKHTNLTQDMLVLCINESNIPVMLGKGILCIGCKPINYDHLNLPHYHQYL